MSEGFAGKPSYYSEEITDLFVPTGIAMTVLGPYAPDNVVPTVVGMRLVGTFASDVTEELAIVVALDEERAVGLIVQLQAMLAEAGVPADRFIAMMEHADRVYREFVTQDQTPSQEPS